MRSIAPEVEGTWDAEWLAADRLRLTDRGDGATKREPYPTLTWRGVRVETVSSNR